MRRSPLSILPAFVTCLAFGLGTTSCGGGAGGQNPDLVLLGFNQPNVAGVALNQPLVFTFSADIDPLSITPDTLRVVGAIGPFFEETIVDGSLVALIPRSPNFDNYSDSGLAPDTTYSVSMPTFPAVDTIESVGGKPLLEAGTFTFRTVPAAALQAPRYAFVETRRRLVHGLPPPTGDSDDLGCLQNRGSSLYEPPLPAISSADPLPQQTNSFAGGRLLCLENEGPPRVIPEECVPLHDQRAVGTPSAGSPNVGKVDLPALVISINEQVDPATVTPYDPATSRSFNLQLWRVALLDGTPIPPEQIKVNKPLLVQKQGSTQLILVASGPVLQGIFLINATGGILDLSQRPLVINDDPNLTGTVYQNLDANLGPGVPQGWRMYFQTLKLPNTASAISETFGANLAEYGDQASTNKEPGVFTRTTVTATPMDPIPLSTPLGATQPSFTLQYGPNPGTALEIGQSTTALWNNGFRFLNLAGLEANTDADSGIGRLKAAYKPYGGTGSDGIFDSDAAPFTPGPGDSLSLSTTPGPGASVNSDGIYEFESFFLRAGDTLAVNGTQPLLILCRGDFQVDGLIDLRGQAGRFGIDTDGSTDYTNSGAITPWGAGGQGGPGGGSGGRGGGPIIAAQANGGIGSQAANLFGLEANGPGGSGAGGAVNANAGGGGGGHATGGAPLAGGVASGGSAGNGGATFGNSLLERALNLFQPDRGYQPNAGATGGPGGGGGGAQDTNGNAGTPDNGDAGAGGGGGGGGAIWVIALGQVRVGAAGAIRASGGAGGSTYDRTNTRIEAGPDNQPGGGDDFASGLKPGAVPSGSGGPGAGGAGGSICLVGGTGVNIQAGGVLNAQGGAGGTSGNVSLYGGVGSDGRILLMSIGALNVSNLGTTLPAPAAPTLWRPTVQLASAGQSTWIDLFVPTVDWAPVVSGVPQVPFTTDNFQFLIDQGALRAPAVGFQWDAVLEYQGADTVTYDGNGVPSAATGMTQWSSNINTADGKRYFRWRCRFFVKDGYNAFGPLALPLPQLTDLTIPLIK